MREISTMYLLPPCQTRVIVLFAGDVQSLHSNGEDIDFGNCYILT